MKGNVEMKRRIFTKAAIISVLLLVSTVFLLFAPYNIDSASTYTDSTVKKYEDMLSKLEQDQKNLQSKISKTKSQATGVMDQKALLDNEIKLCNDQIDIMNSLVIEYDNLIRANEEEIEAKQKDIDEKTAVFEERLVCYYMRGNLNYISVLLGSVNVSDFVMNLQRISSVLESDKKLMETLSNSNKELLVIKERLAGSKERQQSIMQDLKEYEAELEKKSNEAASLISQLNSQTSSYQADIDKILKEQKAIDAELENYLLELKNKSNSTYVGGELLWPTKLSNKKISSYYGWRKLFGKDDFHLGIDIPAPNGDPVYAANAGTVLKSVWHYSYGYYILIDHGGGRSTLYAHNSSLLVKAGDTVTRGQQIAKVGTTGTSTGYHIHFEVRIDGKATNPLGYVVQP